MSDSPQGEGWWQASDGRWYPPEQRASMPPPSPPGPGGDQPSLRGVDAKGVIASLYDFQFDHFVTPRLLRVFYAIFVVILSIGAVIFLLASLASGEGGVVLLSLIFVPVAYLLYLIMTRIYFELVAALFRIADDVHAIRRSKGV